ncbi:hypothetical protein [Paracoccus aerodenitrificans]|uniref:hypothetical protein n=1 Tax=Paracoccus aerodenitrificans TaxID=3017781 RepID=UPI0022F0DCB0|nr:hypothetical protein [Paracoccus aerodenitrificans]WBU62903.1 hypothetical protein PAE61_11040 [Paracoccus aerodenitrificans]
MRNTVLLLVCTLGVAGCDGMNYGMDQDDPYGQYLLTREVALTGQGPVPQTVPKARPFEAPTAEQIAGPNIWGVVRTVPAQATGSRSGGGYYDPATGRRVTGTQQSSSTGRVVAQPVATRQAAVQPVVVQTVPAAPAPAPAPVRPADQPGIEPITTAPVRTNSPDPLIRYAVAQNHAPGTAVYGRQSGSSETAARACARFPNPAAAQMMFLSAGGPQQDTMGMDPDGDGFVCGWNPAPYREGQL